MALVPCRKMLGTKKLGQWGEPYYGIKTSSMMFEVVAVVIRQCALKNCLWQMILGCEWGEKGSERGVVLPSFFIMKHLDSVT